MAEACSFVQTDPEKSNKLTFEQKPKGNEGTGYANIWCKRFPGSGNKYRGPKVGAYLCLEPREKPAMSGVERFFIIFRRD